MTGISAAATRPEPALWRGLTRPELDAAYNNTAAVPDSAERLARWSARSAELRAARPDLLDRRYGSRERQRLDLFRSGRDEAPLLVFIHGGYWQRNAKEVFSCLAQGPLAHGIDVALPGYTLAPAASLTEIVAEITQALHWLRREGPALGMATRRLIVSGWSAGGHLAALAMGRPEVDAGLAVSGIFDLEPCRLNYLNDKLRLTPAEVTALSPIHHLPDVSGPLTVTYGLSELPELQRQSADFAAAWRARGLAGSLRPLASHDHFSILDEMSDPTSALTRAVLDLV
jgi:dienelactone hydrolase